MSHLALYRKYRSQTFGDLIGQEHVVRTLQNSIKGGNFAHAYLFTGPRGTGKTSSARLLAKALNCELGLTGEPCNACNSCLAINEGSHLDVVEMDAASDAGVEDVRARIVDVVDYKPMQGRYKVFIIDEVHDLSGKAFDALLKTVEEPPPHVVFILATTELHKVPPTIQSRCQRYQFNRATTDDLIGRLNFVIDAEGKSAEPGAIRLIARMADGGFRDALSLLEQALVTSGGSLTEEHVLGQLGLIRDDVVDALLKAIVDHDVVAILEKVDEIYRTGRDAKAILEAMIERMAELTRAAYGISGAAEAPFVAAARAQSAALGQDNLLRMRDSMASALTDVRDVSLPRLWLESKLIGFGIAPVAHQVVARPVMQQAVPAASTPTAAPSAKPAAQVQETRQPTTESWAASGDAALDAAAKAWLETKAKISAMSKIAAAALYKTSPHKIEDGELIVAFDRNIDLEKATNNAKLYAAIQKEWATFAPSGLALTFKHLGAGAAVVNQMETAVELPLQGAALTEAARRVFEGE